MPEIAGKWTRQIVTARFKATNYEGVKRWFDAVTELWVENQYPPDHVYNMNESGSRSEQVSRQDRWSTYVRRIAGSKLEAGRSG